MKTSIRDKILKLCLSGLISCAIGVGGFGIYRVNGFVTKHGQDHLQLIAQSEVYRISARLNNIEQYVKTLAYVVQDGLTDIGVLQDSVRREKFTEVNLNFMRATIRNVNSAIAVYLRYNPEFTPPTSGVFLAKTSKNSKIKKQVPTDFSKYDPNDIEHVGWYFVPLYSGQPIWMDPYENKNIDIYMISYVVPLFRFGMEVGVVGVDIDFDYLTREISQIKVLETGFAYLERADGKIAYHPTLEAGSAAVAKDDAVYVRRHLPNGMVLVLEVPKEEITASRNSLIWQISLFTLLLLTVFSVICVRIAKSMAKPLQKLTDAANQLTDGNLDVEFSSASDDEIGELGRSFENARKYMKEYLGYVKGIAYKDSLTGVRNKSAFDNFVRELQQDVDRRLVKKYAVVMLDVNNLKDINDKYGHDFGNKLLVNACQMICEVFSHSPVFRIGGDEFIVVMQEEDYFNRDTLMFEMNEKMRMAAKSTSAWDRVSIAKGLAVYESDMDEHVSAVIRRADEAMYSDKKVMKAFHL